MPTSYVTVRYPTKTYNLVSGKWVLASTSNVDVTTKQIEKPITSYRLKPTDLFANSTDRTVRFTFVQTTLLDFYYTAGTRWDYNVPASHLFPMVASTPSPGLVNWNTLDNRVRKNLRGKAVNLAMFVAEYPKAAALFLSAAKIVSSKGRSLAGALKTRTGVAKTHLAFVYGVQPLASDMVSALDELEDASKVKPRIRGRESMKEHLRAKSTVKLNSTIVTYFAPSELETLNRYAVKYRATLNANSAVSSLALHGFTNPFALAYELTPFSFVLDWWINVGDVLASLDNCLIFEKLEVIRTQYRVRSERVMPVTYRTSNGNGLNGGECALFSVMSYRSATQNLSLISSFEYKPSASLRHITNGLALLQTLKKSL